MDVEGCYVQAGLGRELRLRLDGVDGMDGGGGWRLVLLLAPGGLGVLVKLGLVRVRVLMLVGVGVRVIRRLVLLVMLLVQKLVQVLLLLLLLLMKVLL